jgi:hypothetical protein
MRGRFPQVSGVEMMRLPISVKVGMGESGVKNYNLSIA